MEIKPAVNAGKNCQHRKGSKCFVFEKRTINRVTGKWDSSDVYDCERLRDGYGIACGTDGKMFQKSTRNFFMRRIINWFYD